MHWVGDQNICGTHLPEIFALLPYYGTQPATSPGHACSHNPDIDINTVKVQNISVPIRICHATFKEHLYLSIYGCAGSLLLLAGSLWWWLRGLGLLFVAMCGLLIAMACFVAERSL